MAEPPHAVTVRRTLPIAACGALLIGCAGATLAIAAPQPIGTVLSVYVTFYGAADDDPPGSAAIAYPRVHGPWTGPAPTPIPSNFVMEDDCACRQPRNHVDLWTGGVGHDQRVVAPLYTESTGCHVR